MWSLCFLLDSVLAKNPKKHHRPMTRVLTHSEQVVYDFLDKHDEIPCTEKRFAKQPPRLSDKRCLHIADSEKVLVNVYDTIKSICPNGKIDRAAFSAIMHKIGAPSENFDFIDPSHSLLLVDST